MNWLVVFPALVILAVTTPLAVHALEHRVPCSLNLDKSGIATIRAAEMQTEATTFTLQENEEIVFAELNFEEELAPGTELEIWPAVSGETPPWELVGEDFPFARNIWITDEETGSFVRFEVTDVVRAWQANELANLGFVVRITSEPGEASEQSALAALDSAKEVTLIYHVVPVRAPKTVLEERESDPRKVPNVHDGSGGGD